MRYISTRGDQTQRTFCDILLEGLAPDGGLYLPTHYPKINADTLQSWRGLSYADLAFELMSLFVDDIAAADLRLLIQKTYTADIFGTPQITPLKSLSKGLFLLALSNGPTLAFKDMAMQLLGNLFEYELNRRGVVLNILGATSGDTGSAAEYAMRGKRGINVFMLSPYGRMSAFQQAQMFSLMDANIHNIAIEGVFDDCQDMVKAVSADLEFKQKYHIGSVNSINWARLLAQVVYYFSGYFSATKSNDERVSFAVPSGNFGNICAGHVARRMGLPIEHLVLATNENNVLDEFIQIGTYRVRSSRETPQTSSPSMDISKASNFERFIFDLLGRDADQTRQLFTEELAASGQFKLDAKTFAKVARDEGFVSGHSSHADRLNTIQKTYEQHQVMVDPHTADGLKVAQAYLKPGVPMIVLETALPAKFSTTIAQALGQEPERPAALQDLEQLPRRFAVMANELEPIKRYIAERASAA
jgi:threonine synthase